MFPLAELKNFDLAPSTVLRGRFFFCAQTRCLGKSSEAEEKTREENVTSVKFTGWPPCNPWGDYAEPAFRYHFAEIDNYSAESKQARGGERTTNFSNSDGLSAKHGAAISDTAAPRPRPDEQAAVLDDHDLEKHVGAPRAALSSFPKIASDLSYQTVPYGWLYPHRSFCR